MNEAVSCRWSPAVLAVLFTVMGAAPVSAQRIIATAAGTDWFLSVEGKRAQNVALSSSFQRMTVDAQGNLYVADPLNEVVLKIGLDNVAHVVAGNGIAGFSGDGGPATSASLNYPYAVAVDGSGNMYVADRQNYIIRKITPNGIISTFAGNGFNGYSGDGGASIRASFSSISCLVFDPAKNLLVCDSGNGRLRKINPNGIVSTIAGSDSGYAGDGLPASAASFNGVVDVVSDPAGQLYIADYGNNVVRRIDTKGIMSTFAGNGTFGYSGDGGPAKAATFKSPDGLALDTSGNLYVSEENGSRIRMINTAGIVSTVAGGKQGYTGDGGSPLDASLFFPSGLAFDAAGRLLVADHGNSRIRAIALGTSIQTMAGNGLFRFSPDQTPASKTFLFRPSAVALDGAGNLYIADTENFVVRKITPDGIGQTVAGIGINAYSPNAQPATRTAISFPEGLTIAPNGDLIIADFGNGRIERVGADGVSHVIAGSLATPRGYGGDGGAATSAFLNHPVGLAFDAAGKLYIADSGNHRVRVVSNGTIATFAGNGTPQSSGDGQLATNASLNTPYGVAVDSAGNVYIGEYFGRRIRKVTPDGKISTFAGNGVSASNGDGGAATSAAIGNVFGLSFDAQGNLYFSEASNHKVRRVTPAGTITTVAGTGTPKFLGDGGPATGAALNAPAGLAVGPDGTIYVADGGNDRVRALLSVNPAVSASATQLSFNLSSGGSASAQQTITLGSTIQGAASSGLPFSVTATTVSGSGWLQVTPGNGTIPAVIGVSVDPGTLAPGAYQGTVLINTPGAVPPQTVVGITATVTDPNPPKIALGSTQLAFSTQAGAAASTRVLSISNAGGNTLNVAVSPSGGAWLSVSPASGSATPNAPLSVTVAVNPGSMQPGTYSGNVRIASDAEQIDVPVTMTISQPQSVLVLSQTGLAFTAVAEGGAPLPQSFGILNIGNGSMDWTAAASTLSGGSWLSLSRAGGTVATAYLDVSSVDAAVNAAGLAAGVYYGQIKVTVAGANNSPQTISVVLNVLEPGSDPGPEVQPTGLIFAGTTDGAPGSQTVMISNPSAADVTFASSQATIPAGGNWLSYIPAGASLSPGQPVKLTAQPNFSGLAPGIQRGLISMLFSNNSIRNVSVLAVVAPAGGNAAPGKDGVRQAGACTPGSLVVQPTSMTDQFSVTLLQPAALQARVVDNCAAAITKGSVTVNFSNGDPMVSLIHVGNGAWSGTWQPKNGSQPQVQIAFTAVNDQPGQDQPIGGQVKISGRLLPAGGAPPLASSVVNAASGKSTYVSPGGSVSIYGQQLADQTGGSNAPPFPTELNGTQVLLGDKPLPLRYVGAGQVNAQIPFELAVNTQHQLVVRRGTTVSQPENIVVAPAQPAVYTQDQSGSGPGVIVDASNNNVLVTAAAPAQAGHSIVIYCNGLGAVNPALSSGNPAPLLGPLSRTENAVTVTIGGHTAEVDFAGLSPGYSDLYQVNAVVPEGVTGDSVPVVLTVAGQTSQPVTMTIR